MLTDFRVSNGVWGYKPTDELEKEGFVVAGEWANRAGLIHVDRTVEAPQEPDVSCVVS